MNKDEKVKKSKRIHEKSISYHESNLSNTTNKKHDLNS